MTSLLRTFGQWDIISTNLGDYLTDGSVVSTWSPSVDPNSALEWACSVAILRLLLVLVLPLHHPSLALAVAIASTGPSVKVQNPNLTVQIVNRLRVPKSCHMWLWLLLRASVFWLPTSDYIYGRGSSIR